MSKELENESEYIAAIEERKCLAAMLEKGQKSFTGYALEMFEHGLAVRIYRLGLNITEYEVLRELGIN